MRIPFLELFLYYAVFFASILYSIVRFYQTSAEHLDDIDPEDLRRPRPGTWIGVGVHGERPLDVSDLEWQSLKRFYLQNKILFLLAHSFGFRLVKTFLGSPYCPIYVILYSTLALIYILSPHYLICIYLNIAAVLIVSFLLKHYDVDLKIKQTVHYIMFAFAIAIIHKQEFSLDREHSLLVQVSFSWLNAKLLSCCFDDLDDDREFRNLDRTPPKQSLPIKLAYLLYFPPFFFGPIYHFSNFQYSIENLSQGSFFLDLFKLGRYLLWAWILELILHFIYSSAFQYYVFLTENLDAWSLCGFGYSLMVLFFVKYFVIYGVTRQLAIIDGLAGVIEKPPECVSHIHRTSYLWRKFDRGLYQFLLKYFYKPITGTHYDILWRRFLAASVCFGVIALWHGYYDAIIVWVTTNIILSYSEILGSIFASKLQIQNSRIVQMFGAPYLALAYASNMFFLSNFETGMIFVTKILLDRPLLPLLIVLYCGCHVCDDINQRIKLQK